MQLLYRLCTDNICEFKITSINRLSTNEKKNDSIQAKLGNINKEKEIGEKNPMEEILYIRNTNRKKNDFDGKCLSRLDIAKEIFQ